MKKDKSKIILIAIIVLAILIRCVYVFKTNISEFQYDVGLLYDNGFNYEDLYKDFDKEPNEARHINYIMHLYTYGSLPQEILGQFYHPPLHHFLMASTLKIMDGFSENAEFKFETMQVVTFAYSVVILWGLYKILDEMGIENKYKIIPMAIFAFYPLNIYMSGSINNDELVTMFSVLVLLYLMKWNKNPGFKNTIIVATCIGLGLMTKTSMFVMMIPAIYVYFKVLIDFVNSDKKIGKLLIELLIFIVIVSTLGLWFQAKNLIEGKNTLGIIQPYESLSVKDASMWDRIGIPNPFVMSGVNTWNYLMYSSLNFGVFLENSVYIRLMIVLLITLVVDSIYYMIKNFKEEKLLITTFISWWIFYFILNFQMPYTCSMHSRYMVVPISIAILFIAKGLLKEEDKFIKTQVYASTILFSLMSMGIFLFII